jgi:hypothetical protein
MIELELLLSIYVKRRKLTGTGNQKVEGWSHIQ